MVERYMSFWVSAYFQGRSLLESGATGFDQHILGSGNGKLGDVLVLRNEEGAKILDPQKPTKTQIGKTQTRIPEGPPNPFQNPWIFFL